MKYEHTHLKMFFIHRIIEFKYDNGKNLLPTCVFLLSSGAKKFQVIGFLPCHHSNVGYELELQDNKIITIISIKLIKKKSELPKLRDIRFPNYTGKALKALENRNLWVLSVIYTIYELKKIDIDSQFNALNDDIERCCQRGFPHARFLYKVDKAVELINRALVVMGKPQYDDFVGFKKRMSWQFQTRYSTAIKSPNIPKKKPVGFEKCWKNFKPPVTYEGVMKYKEVYSTATEIECAEQIATVFTPQITTLIRGSLGDISGDIVVLNLEDAYRIRCQTDNRCQIYMMEMPDFTGCTEGSVQFFLKRRGLGNIKLLPEKNEHVYIAWSHLWGVEDFLKLITFGSLSYTLIGRLDQYQGTGRGQIYRDMLESGLFQTKVVQHVGTDNVVTLESDDLAATIKNIVSKHVTVQCFTSSDYDNSDGKIDTGRVGLVNPFRIRSKRDRKTTHNNMRYPMLPLIEEYWINEKKQKKSMKNASVVNVRKFKGVYVHAAIFLCSEKTTAFDVAVAKTYCRESLYLINGGNYMLLKNEAPSRITVNPFM